ncbi:MAG: hypothetical protein ACOX2K_00830 [Bacillota bacterium]|jgi:hypothetical protein
MSQAAVSKRVQTIHRSRRLPIPGEVLVQRGQQVAADTVIAYTEIPGVPIPVKVALRLSIEPKHIHRFMLKQEGDMVEAGEALAVHTSLFGLSRDYVYSPRGGTVESISPQTGVVVVREPSIPVSTLAYLPGEVEELIPGEGAVIKATGLVLTGVFGVGNERFGPLLVPVEHPGQALSPDMLTSAARGAVVVGGGTVSAEVLKRAAQLQVAAIVSGSVSSAALVEYLGYEVGVPITGQEDVVSTLIITSGFGSLPMDPELFGLLQASAGKMVSVNGTTHLRSQLIKPEVFIPA